MTRNAYAMALELISLSRGALKRLDEVTEATPTTEWFRGYFTDRITEAEAAIAELNNIEAEEREGSEE